MKALLNRAFQQDATRNDSLPDPAWSRDQRLHPLHTHSQLSFQPPDSLAAWGKRREALALQVRVAAGLYPWPERVDRAAEAYDRRQMDGFSVQKCRFQSHPGFWVTGNLYEPAEGCGQPRPAVLVFHGHWPGGRLEDSEHCSTLQLCADLARMGMVVLSIDMLGYQDSLQVSHGFGLQPDCQRHGIHSLGLQLWNGRCALDYLCDLPGVDGARIGCTGASGGATQAFLLAAIDHRVAAVVPVNMLSLFMQGGCACENAPLLRWGTNNLELAALIAPRPMLMVGSDGDWTREMLTVDEPLMRRVYQLYGAQGRLSAFFQQTPHNYNQAARQAACAFFAIWLLREERVPAMLPHGLKARMLRLYPDDVLPEGILQGDEAVAALLIGRRRQAMRALLAGEAAPREELLHVLRLVLRVTDSPPAFELQQELVADGLQLQRGLLLGEAGEAIPCCLLWRAGDKPVQAQLLLAEEGMQAALRRADPPAPGTALCAVDLFLTGAYAAPGFAAGRAGLAHLSCFQHGDDVMQLSDIHLSCLYLLKRFRSLSIQASGRLAQLVGLLASFHPAARAYQGAGVDQLHIPGIEGLQLEALIAHITADL